MIGDLGWRAVPRLTTSRPVLLRHFAAGGPQRSSASLRRLRIECVLQQPLMERWAAVEMVTLVTLVTGIDEPMIRDKGSLMKRLSFLVSLTNNDNDYQQEQAAAAEKAARRFGVDVKIIHANNDALTQSQQLLHYVQDASVPKPDAIMFEPAGGTAFPQVARAAAAAGIGWVVLNHEVDYIMELRRQYKVPVYAITSDHEEVGKIQGQQFTALLPNGGSMLYIEGPNNSSAAKQRSVGTTKIKPMNIQVKTMRANWTEESAYRAVSSWLRLRTSMEAHIDLVGAQDDRDRKSTRLNSSHIPLSRMPSSA